MPKPRLLISKTASVSAAPPDNRSTTKPQRRHSIVPTPPAPRSANPLTDQHWVKNTYHNKKPRQHLGAAIPPQQFCQPGNGSSVCDRFCGRTAQTGTMFRFGRRSPSDIRLSVLFRTSLIQRRSPPCSVPGVAPSGSADFTRDCKFSPPHTLPRSLVAFSFCTSATRLEEGRGEA